MDMTPTVTLDIEYGVLSASLADLLLYACRCCNWYVPRLVFGQDRSDAAQRIWKTEVRLSFYSRSNAEAKMCSVRRDATSPWKIGS